jgi:diaminopimelate epimerase
MHDIAFLKMDGCGNDYVFVDCLSAPLAVDPSRLAKVVSDRNTGVGSDGLVLILPPRSADAQASMRMFNADGTESAMCGNALRCLALWLHQSGHVTDSCRIDIGSRVVLAEIRSSFSEQRAGVVSVVLGPPDQISPEQKSSVRSVSGYLDEAGNSGPASSPRTPFLRTMELLPPGLLPEASTLLQVAVGNPHVVCFLKNIADLDLRRIGPIIEHDVRFPDRTNVNFVQKIDRRSAFVRVWERGCGETRACGSGACAVAVAGISTGEFDSGQPVKLTMPGGVLQVQWEASDNLRLTGPAREAFRGTIRIDQYEPDQ